MIPADVRRELGIVEGAVLAASTVDGRLVLEPREEVLARVRRRFRGVADGVRLADGLIADRREEVRRERL